MCLFLDANMYDPFLNSEKNMKPVRDWVEKKNGKIVYSPVGKIKEELDKKPKMKKKFTEYSRMGRLKLIEPIFVEQKKEALPKLKSNDPYIIALAQASRVKLLVSGDRKLHTDFKNKKIIGGKVISDKTSQLGVKRLLTKDLCP